MFFWADFNAGNGATNDGNDPDSTIPLPLLLLLLLLLVDPMGCDCMFNADNFADGVSSPFACKGSMPKDRRNNRDEPPLVIDTELPSTCLLCPCVPLPEEEGVLLLDGVTVPGDEKVALPKERR